MSSGASEKGKTVFSLGEPLRRLLYTFQAIIQAAYYLPRRQNPQFHEKRETPLGAIHVAHSFPLFLS